MVRETGEGITKDVRNNVIRQQAARKQANEGGCSPLQTLFNKHILLVNK